MSRVDHDATGVPDAGLERSEQRVADGARWEQARDAWAQKRAAQRAAMTARDVALEDAAQEWATHQTDADLVGWSLRMHLAELREWIQTDEARSLGEDTPASLPDPRDADEALRWVSMLETVLESERESREALASEPTCSRPRECYCRECEPTHIGNTYRDGQCWVCGARGHNSEGLRAGDSCQRCQSRALVNGLKASVREEDR